MNLRKRRIESSNLHVVNVSDYDGDNELNDSDSSSTNSGFQNKIARKKKQKMVMLQIPIAPSIGYRVKPSFSSNSSEIKKKNDQRHVAILRRDRTSTNTREAMKNKNQNQDRQNILHSLLKSHNTMFSIKRNISLEDAVSLSSEARLVTEAEFPFLAVHANAAFRTFSGLLTQPIIGKPLSEILSDSGKFNEKGSTSNLIDHTYQTMIYNVYDTRKVISSSESSGNFSDEKIIIDKQEYSHYMIVLDPPMNIVA